MEFGDTDYVERIMAAQDRIIRERFGERAAYFANYGWFQDPVLGYVETKIYFEPRYVITSWVSVVDDHTIHHDLHPYQEPPAT